MSCLSAACVSPATPRRAARHVEACTELFRRELGIEPTAALRTAAATSEVAVIARVSGRAACERRSRPARQRSPPARSKPVCTVCAAPSPPVEPPTTASSSRRRWSRSGARSSTAARGTDEEGAAALHEGTTLAEQVGRFDVAAKGWREISWVQFLRAHYERAEESLTNTAEFAAGNDEELAWVDLIRGACRHDVGDYAAAGELLRSALARARRLASGQPLGQALTLLGRFHLLRGEIQDAVHLLDEALERPRRAA